MRSERLHRLTLLLRDTRNAHSDTLIQVVREKHRFTPLLRVAALRELIGRAPVEVTLGRPYLERRRLVRQHFGI